MNKRGVACPAMDLTFRHYDQLVQYVSYEGKTIYFLLNG